MFVFKTQIFLDHSGNQRQTCLVIKSTAQSMDESI